MSLDVQLRMRGGQQDGIPGGLREDAAAISRQSHHSLGGHHLDLPAHVPLDYRNLLRSNQPYRSPAGGLPELQGTFDAFGNLQPAN